MSGPVLCVGAVAVDADRLLLVRRGALRGGALEPPPAGGWKKEALAEAVVRELREETGVEAVCEGLVGWAEIFDGGHWVVLDFAVTVLAGEATAGDDAVEAAWVPLGEVADLLLTEGLAEFLHEHGILSTYT